MKFLNKNNAMRCLSIASISVCIIYIYIPIAFVIAYSFNMSKSGSHWTGFTFHWYNELALNKSLINSFFVSCGVAAVVSTVSTFIAFLAALGINKWSFIRKRLANSFFASIMIVPDLIFAVSLAIFFSSVQFRMSLVTVIISHISFCISYAYFIISPSISDFDDTLISAAQDCNANPFQSIVFVQIPIVFPSLIVSWLLVFAVSLDDFMVTFFTKGTGSDTLPIKIYSQLRFGLRPSTNALSSVLFFLMLLVMTIAYYYRLRIAKKRSY